jgi:hypothetical protein
MEKAIFSKQIGEYLYQVFYDQEPINADFDFGDEEANAAYLKRFEDEEIFSYNVVKSKLCECCKQWKDIDSLCAIHADSEFEALEMAIDSMQ